MHYLHIGKEKEGYRIICRKSLFPQNEMAIFLAMKEEIEKELNTEILPTSFNRI